MGAGRVSRLAGSCQLLGELLVELLHRLLPWWLLGLGEADSHGNSRWARASERDRLGQVGRAERMNGDGIVLGWHYGRLLQSPAEDSVILFGVQRSGKTSTVVVPTLLGWQGAIVATSTKEELVALTAHHRSAIGHVSVFAPLDRDNTWIEALGLRPASWNPIEALDSTGAA